MRLYFELFVLGLPIAGLFALLATGVVMIYRASKILTLAQGAVAMFTAYVVYQISNDPSVEAGARGWHLPHWLAIVTALVFAGVLGFVIERFLLRPLRDRPVLVSVIMTVGLLALLTAIAGIVWSYNGREALPLVRKEAFHVAGITLPYDRLLTLAVTGMLLLGVVYLFKRTTLGIAMRAVADDRHAALLMGIPADRVSSLTWIIGSLLAGAAGILLSPIVVLHPLTLTLLSIPAYAAALFGGLTNLPRMLIGALIVGVLYSEVPALPAIKTGSFPGVRELSIFAVVIVFMFVTGQSTQLQEEEI